jgi:murein L,D-transpeptidase YcbB/YkuD
VTNFRGFFLSGNTLLYCTVAVLALVGMCQCTTNGKSTDVWQNGFGRSRSDERTDQVRDQIQQLLDSTLQTAENQNASFEQVLVVKHALIRFYQQRNWEPAWCTNQHTNTQADSLLLQLSHVRDFGLLPSFYATDSLRQAIARANQTLSEDTQTTLLAQCDIGLTQAALQWAGHLRKGRLHPSTRRPIWHHQWLADSATGHLQQVVSDKQWQKFVQSCQPRWVFYQQLQKATACFVQRHPELKATADPLADPRQDSLAFFRQLKQRLVGDGFVPDFADTLAVAVQQASMQKALRAFQQSRGLSASGKPDKATLAALQIPEQELFNRLAITLEKLRWESFPDSAYVLVNIPAYQLYLYRGENRIMQRRVITGRPDAQTPELSSAINYFVIAPEWNVPRSIAVKELLPHIKRNVSYLANNHYLLLDAAKNPVDPSTVSWSQINEGNFPYTVRQQAGCDNALGNLLFHFPNRYNFYLHDTPDRRLFQRTYRALSHSCIRMDDPADLAEYLLHREHHNDTVTHTMIERCQQKRERRQYNLAHPLPIHIRYYTCASEQTVLYFYPDVYQKDPSLLKAWLTSP